MRRRPTRTGIASVRAFCHGCPWVSEARNALGNAARHHDATGHEVAVEQSLIVVYGEAPRPEELGQETLDDVGDAPTLSA